MAIVGAAPRHDRAGPGRVRGGDQAAENLAARHQRAAVRRRRFRRSSPRSAGRRGSRRPSALVMDRAGRSARLALAGMHAADPALAQAARPLQPPDVLATVRCSRSAGARLALPPDLPRRRALGCGPGWRTAVAGCAWCFSLSRASRVGRCCRTWCVPRATSRCSCARSLASCSSYHRLGALVALDLATAPSSLGAPLGDLAP